jgi:hypothetical protein
MNARTDGTVTFRCGCSYKVKRDEELPTHCPNHRPEEGGGDAAFMWDKNASHRLDIWDKNIITITISPDAEIVHDPNFDTDYSHLFNRLEKLLDEARKKS